MNKIILLVIGTATIVSVQAFAQQSDSPSSIAFESEDGTAVPVFEVVGQSSGFGSIWFGGQSGGMTSQSTALRPAFMAPTTIDVPNGWHRYQIGESLLFRKQFDVVAQGDSQRWLLSNGHPGLNIAGWLIYAAGVGFATWGGIEWATPVTPYSTSTMSTGAAEVMTIGGVVAFVGGIVLIFSTLPNTTRTQ